MERLNILGLVGWRCWGLDALCVDGLLVVHQTEEVSEQHGDGDLADGGDVERGDLLDVFVDEVLFAGKVDDNGAPLNVLGGELVGFRRDPGDDDVGDAGALLERLVAVENLVLLVSEAVASLVELDVVDVCGVDGGAVVGEEGGEGSADDLGAVDDGDGFPIEPVAVVQDLVVCADVLEDLDDGQGRAGQNRLHCLGLVQETHVVVHVGDVLEVEALDVLVDGHALLEVLVLLVTKHREVHNHAVDVVVVVALVDLLLELVLGHLDEFVLEPQRVGGLSCPRGVHHGSRVVVGEKPDKLRLAGEPRRGVGDLLEVGFGDFRRRDDLAGFDSSGHGGQWVQWGGVRDGRELRNRNRGRLQAKTAKTSKDAETKTCPGENACLKGRIEGHRVWI